MKLKNVEIEDDFPLFISLCGKSIWKRNENDEIVVACLLDRQEDNFQITNISSVEVKPSEDKNKIVNVLQYFFSVCDRSLSPQCLWGTNDCSYNSLLMDYDMSEKEQFETVFNELTIMFPELKKSKSFTEKIPKGKTLLDVVSQIEVAYPRTWTVDYVK